MSVQKYCQIDYIQQNVENKKRLEVDSTAHCEAYVWSVLIDVLSYLSY